MSFEQIKAFTKLLYSMIYLQIQWISKYYLQPFKF